MENANGHQTFFPYSNPNSKSVITNKNPYIYSNISIQTSNRFSIKRIPKILNPISISEEKTMKFHRAGEVVEITSNEEGFLGSYYEATVVATGQLRKEYMVQYHTLLKDDMSGPLREIVPAAEVRPPPPEIPVTEFKLHDQVDAFDNDGWWVGKVIARIGNKYIVYFECSSKDEFVYDFERLRIHQDWVNGRWVLPKNQARRLFY